ncbi:MAG: hypothetical protein RIS92_537 [Verrucomicrobiota bacterium]
MEWWAGRGILDEVRFPCGGEAFGEGCSTVGFGLRGPCRWGCEGAWGGDLAGVFYQRAWGRGVERGGLNDEWAGRNHGGELCVAESFEETEQVVIEGF